MPQVTQRPREFGGRLAQVVMMLQVERELNAGHAPVEGEGFSNLKPVQLLPVGVIEHGGGTRQLREGQRPGGAIGCLQDAEAREVQGQFAAPVNQVQVRPERQELFGRSGFQQVVELAVLHAPEVKPGQGETALLTADPDLRHLGQGRDDREYVCCPTCVLCRLDQVIQCSLCVVTEQQVTERNQGIWHSESLAGFD